MAANAPKGATGDADILKRARIAYAVLLSSQGLAFIHAGDEMFRTKETTGAYANTKNNGSRFFVDNSYNASDAINQVKWSNVYAGDPIGGGFTNYATTSNGYLLYTYVQGLAALRKSTNAFRLTDASRAANISSIAPVGVGSSTLAFGYKCVGTDAAYYVFHNADTAPKSFTADIDLSTSTLVVDGAAAGTTAIGVPTGVTISGTTVTLQPLTSAIFRK
jgi:pullulanase/glycogen debranching enzyme